ncbi:MAG: hypothetical protein CM1200mP2_08170 [Planctomycetaceae bacterium]|nr:MAG: hypothetical protein CM1200mP2_08170 [Planctomycetaceae bacterium]
MAGPETIEVTVGSKTPSGGGCTRRSSRACPSSEVSSRRRFANWVPTLITEMEQRLEFADSSDLFRACGRCRSTTPGGLWPEAVAVEKSGLSIAIGMTVAAPDPSTAPRSPREMILVKDPVKRIPRTQTLRVGFAPGLLDP